MNLMKQTGNRGSTEAYINLFRAGPGMWTGVAPNGPAPGTSTHGWGRPSALEDTCALDTARRRWGQAAVVQGGR